MKNKTIWVIGGGLALIVALFVINAMTPGRLDAFAQCLEDQGVTFYGAFWCPHCAEQKQMFGKSVSELPYVECSTPDGQQQLPICQDAGIQSYPTWEFSDGSRTQGVMQLAALAEKTGCELPQ